MRFGFVQILLLFLVIPSTAAVIYVFYLLIKALRKYTKSESVRKAKAEDAKNARRSSEKTPDGLQNDAGICGRNPGREPSGGFQMGKRCVRSQHHESDGAG